MEPHDLIAARFGRHYDIDPAACGETVSALLTHRSCRDFSDDPVPEPLLTTLFCAAFSAPSKSDLQQACVIRVGEDNKRAIAAQSEDVGWIAGAPVFMVWCGDSRRIRALAELRDNPFANDHLDAFMNAAVDAGIAMATFVLAAESRGLGCCPVSQVRDRIDALSATLQLPRHVFPVAGLCVGWPGEAGAVSMRLPLEVTVHDDKYDDGAMVEQVNDYDRRREQADRAAGRSGPVWSVRRTGQYSVPARADFGDYIRRQGFDLS